jgi:dienelactone hydrolase
MSEYALNIPVPDTDFRLNGWLREVDGAPLVILVHGITGHCNEVQFWAAARALEAAGFSSYRFNLYDAPYNNGRPFVDCTIEIHAADLDLAVRTLRAQQPDRPIAVIGHSLGGMTVLSSTERGFDAAVLWDPSHGDRGKRNTSGETGYFERVGDGWIAHENVPVVLGEAMIDSWVTHPTDELMAAFDKPVKIIAAGESGLLPTAQRLQAAATVDCELAVVDGADHCFLVGDTANVLFAETVDWLRRTL